MAHQLLRNLDQIRRAEWFAVIADETQDMSGHEQLGISVRWVDGSYNVHEDLIGLIEVEMTDAATLASTLKDTLLRCNLQLVQCRGQAYDGASNMAGHLTGVSTRIQAEEPRALYTAWHIASTYAYKTVPESAIRNQGHNHQHSLSTYEHM